MVIISLHITVIYRGKWVFGGKTEIVEDGLNLGNVSFFVEFSFCYVQEFIAKVYSTKDFKGWSSSHGALG
jgi:hypothetical protein